MTVKRSLAAMAGAAANEPTAAERMACFSSRPTEADLEGLVDQLGRIREAAVKQVERLKARKLKIQRQIDAADAEACAVAEYLRVHLERLDLDGVEGQRYRSRLEKNSRPSFQVLGDAADLPARFRRVTYRLDDAAALAAWKAGEALPEQVAAEHGNHVKIEALS